jgi:hypothetical protein
MRKLWSLVLTAAMLLSLAAVGIGELSAGVAATEMSPITGFGSARADWSELAQTYADVENGARLPDGGILLYYPVYDLYDGGELARRGLLSLAEDAEAFGPIPVALELPFESDAAKFSFLEKYENGWNLVDTVSAQPAGGGQFAADGAPNDSVAYLVTDGGGVFEFIFINRGGDAFSVHIDSYNSAKTVTAAVTKYAEIMEVAPIESAPEPTEEGQTELPAEEPEDAQVPDAPDEGANGEDAELPEPPPPATSEEPESPELTDDPGSDVLPEEQDAGVVGESETQPESPADTDDFAAPDATDTDASTQSDTSGYEFTAFADKPVPVVPLVAYGDKAFAVRLAAGPVDIDGDNEAGIGDNENPANSEIAETAYSEVDPADFTSLPVTYPMDDDEGIDSVSTATVIITDQEGTESVEFPTDLQPGQVWTDKSVTEGTYDEVEGEFTSGDEGQNGGYFLVTLYAKGATFGTTTDGSTGGGYQNIQLASLAANTVANNTYYAAGAIVKSGSVYVVCIYTHTAQGNPPATANGNYWWALPVNGNSVAIPADYNNSTAYSSTNGSFVTYNNAIWVLTSNNGPTARNNVKGTAPAEGATNPWAKVLDLTYIPDTPTTSDGINPLNEGTDLTVTDTFGAEYEYKGLYPTSQTVSVTSSDGAVTWTVAHDDITKDNSVSYIVKLKDVDDEGTYATGKATAKFTPAYEENDSNDPAKHNPFYYVNGQTSGTRCISARVTVGWGTYQQTTGNVDANIVTKIEVGASGLPELGVSEEWITLFANSSYGQTIDTENNYARNYVFTSSESTIGTYSATIIWSLAEGASTGSSFARIILTKNGVTTNFDFTMSITNQAATTTYTDIPSDTVTVYTQFTQREKSDDGTIAFVWGTDNLHQIIQQHERVGTTTTQFPLRFAVYDATLGEWMEGVELALQLKSADTATSIGTTSGTFATVDMTSILAPGEYTLTQTLDEESHVGFVAPKEITFTVAQIDGKASPRITNVEGAAFADCTGLVLFIYNTRIPVELTVTKTVSGSISANAQGAPTFLFEVEKLDAEGVLVATWVDVVTVNESNGAASPETFVAFDLPWGWKYRVTELNSMRYKVAEESGVTVTGVSGTVSGSTATIDLTTANGATLTDDGVCKITVAFKNERTSGQYLTSSAYALNKFSVGTTP